MICAPFVRGNKSYSSVAHKRRRRIDASRGDVHHARIPVHTPLPPHVQQYLFEHRALISQVSISLHVSLPALSILYPLPLVLAYTRVKVKSYRYPVITILYVDEVPTTLACWAPAKPPLKFQKSSTNFTSLAPLTCQLFVHISLSLVMPPENK